MKIAIAGKGGTGKTTIVGSMARELARRGHKVTALERTAFGPLRLGRLKRGAWRVLTEGEVSALRRAAGLR